MKENSSEFGTRAMMVNHCYTSAAPEWPPLARSGRQQLARSRHRFRITSSELARFQTPPISLNPFEALFREADLPLLKLPADNDETLRFSLA